MPALAAREWAGGPAFVARLTTFAALAAFAAGHWAGLVEGSSGWRVLAIVAIVCAGGAALALSGGLRRRTALPVRLPVTLLTLVAGVAAAGLPLRLLGWRNWGELGENVDRGLAGVPSVNWPYSGNEEWVGLTILLLAPLVCAVAAALAFWPAGRASGALRAGALVLLVALYGVAVTEHDFGAGLVRGLALFLLIAAWIWLPRVRRTDAVLAACAVLAVGGLALPVAARADGEDALVDYRSWQLFGADEGATFNWNHTYGPIDWQRDGSTLLIVKSKQAHYWKAETLDRFDGFRWLHTDANDRVPLSFELPDEPRLKWAERIGFTVRGLSTSLVVGAGTTFDVTGAGIVSGSGDGTVRKLDDPLEEGDTYRVQSYVPDPSAREMRAAGETVNAHFNQYLTIALPRPGENALNLGEATGRPAGPAPEVLTVGAGVTPPMAEAAKQQLLASPYARVYELAQRLAVGQATTYDIVKRIETHLLRNFGYSERPPSQEYPLAAFLFEDRRGYCQQFSGAMALMLRMNGIPARVAAGFTPGSYNRETQEYRVRDLDAHSWVEVYFEGLGWVPFDPTPSSAPAESQLGGPDIDSAANRDSGAPNPDSGSPIPDRAGDAGAGAAGGDGEGGRPWLVAVALAGLGTLAGGAFFLRSRMRTRRRLSAEPDAPLHELRRALERLGYDIAPGTTLAELERRLGEEAGPGAARYVRRLNDGRYARVPARAPGRAARRALRRALSARRGRLGRVRGYLALPPRVGAR
jgi:transglutaminase-like putative cysteine protease